LHFLPSQTGLHVGSKPLIYTVITGDFHNNVVKGQSADGQTLQQDHQEAESTSNPVNMGD
jgi:hypothetical protein